MNSSKSRLSIVALNLLIIVLLTACNTTADASNSLTYSVDSTFIDFYQGLGDISTLGPAISPSFIKGGITYQYILSGLLVYDPNQGSLHRFYFSPIASREWKISSIVEPATSDSNLTYANGHRIWEEVWPFYSQFGSDLLGLPLTGVIANDEKQRYEQYFEGVGFYRRYADIPGEIHLLPYGAWMCGDSCSYKESDGLPKLTTFVRDFSETEQLFLQESLRFGYGFTGAPLAAPEMASDGNFEMAFENVILYIDPSVGNHIRLRPLPSWLGIQADNPTQETKADWLTFYQAGEGVGFNIPITFSKYISDHGGVTISGYPITEYRLLADGGYNQCYTNICLEYHPTAPETLRIRPHALGLDFHTGGGSDAVPDVSLAQALQINAYEQFPLISSGQRQAINIEVLQDNTSVSGVELSLFVQQPDGITKTYKLNPTGADGKTVIDLDPIYGPNGTIIEYKLCVVGAVAPQVCFSRSYTIWEQ